MNRRWSPAQEDACEPWIVIAPFWHHRILPPDLSMAIRDSAGHLADALRQTGMAPAPFRLA